ncbi:unnamed protein product [Notodromas monacha]|uniref:Uncharacterized protein n=1 Tax=Notodromas monacha TaxID=399045 RepID=A0A7R9GHV9_9CRUS|nr:unnamed protein product [Notodromas monacha]CAG0921931.1 unnamed protein product [Notodromas monacha]
MMMMMMKWHSAVVLVWFLSSAPSLSSAFFYEVNVDPFHEPVPLSPVQVMFLGPAFLALALLSSLGYLPLKLASPKLGPAIIRRDKHHDPGLSQRALSLPAESTNYWRDNRNPAQAAAAAGLRLVRPGPGIRGWIAVARVKKFEKVYVIMVQLKRMARRFALALAVLMIVQKPVAGIFPFMEVDYLNETIELSPVQIMMLGAFILFIAIARIFNYLPIDGSPNFIGRTAHNYQFAQLSFSSISDSSRFGRALLTSDWKSCLGEIACEVENASRRYTDASNVIDTSSPHFAASRDDADAIGGGGGAGGGIFRPRDCSGEYKACAFNFRSVARSFFSHKR